MKKKKPYCTAKRKCILLTDQKWKVNTWQYDEIVCDKMPPDDAGSEEQTHTLLGF